MNSSLFLGCYSGVVKKGELPLRGAPHYPPEALAVPRSVPHACYLLLRRACRGKNMLFLNILPRPYALSSPLERLLMNSLKYTARFLNPISKILSLFMQGYKNNLSSIFKS